MDDKKKKVIKNKANPKLFLVIKDLKRFFKLSYWKNNFSELIALILYVLFHVALITYVLIIRANTTVPVKFARVPGMLLNLNCAFIILLVLKRLITWFRTSEIGRKVSVLDGALDIHKIIGFWLAFLSLVHSFGHFFNFC